MSHTLAHSRQREIPQGDWFQVHEFQSLNMNRGINTILFFTTPVNPKTLRLKEAPHDVYSMHAGVKQEPAPNHT